MRVGGHQIAPPTAITTTLLAARPSCHHTQLTELNEHFDLDKQVAFPSHLVADALVKG